MLRFAIALSTTLALAGCVTQQSWSREQAEAATTRDYAEFSQQQLLRAGEAAIRNSQLGNVTFAYFDDGFSAQRSSFQFLVIAAANFTYTYRFDVSEGADGSRARMNMFVSTDQTTATTIGAVDSRLPSTPVQNEAVYNLFFARLDHALGLRPDFPPCPSRVGDYEALCLGAGSD